MRHGLDLNSIAEKAEQVKAAFREKGIEIVLNISLNDMMRLVKSMEDPDAAKREVEEQTRKAIAIAMEKLEVAKAKELEKKKEGKRWKKLDENFFSKEILMPYRAAIEMEVVPSDSWNRKAFNETFGLNINEKNWGRWINGNEGCGYTSQETRYLEKAYSQFIIGF